MIGKSTGKRNLSLPTSNQVTCENCGLVYEGAHVCPPKILFGILSTYERQGWIHPSILQFFADLPFTQGNAYRVVPVHNFMPAASGRNVFCKQVKDTDCDWVCMIDNDMSMPKNLIDTLKDAPADASIVVPAFYAWAQSELKLTLCWGMDNVPDSNPTAKLASGFHELTKAGTGVIFIRPEVFRKLAYPYFTYLYNEDQGMCGTEDIQFCLRAREAGFKIYGNADVIVGHYHNVDLSTLWKWYEKSNGKVVDTKPDTAAESGPKDAPCPDAPLATNASPAIAA